MAWRISRILLLLSLVIGALLISRFARGNQDFEGLSLSTVAEHARNFRGGSSSSHVSQHPILVLAQRAEAAFDDMLGRQSNTYEQAVTEYMRRYERSPPPGFKHWYDYAVAEKSPIIDNFDILEDAITPFLRYSGAEIDQHMTNARESDSNTWECSIRNQRLGIGCEGLGEPLLRLFGDARILPHLPNVDLMLNGFDEPRVLLPGTSASRARRSSNQIRWMNLGHHDVWDLVVTKQCARRSGGESIIDRTSRDESVDDMGLNLVQNSFEAMDICQHPEYRGMHAFFSSPDSFKATNAILPILSPGIVSTMNDIPYPATAYNSGGYKFNEADAVQWEKKTHALYWAGKTTGGRQHFNEEWKNFHRHRFVSLTNDMEPRAFTYLQRDSEGADWHEVERESLNADSFHTYFTEVVQCEAEICDSVREHFKMHDADPGSEISKYTLNFDTDGNGHSGRYYRLLASHSLPLKQTIFREWHDDRLQPWLHYVPISLSMDELPEVVRYLTEEEEGRELAQKLAEKGREWTKRALRPVDQVVYLFRLMLELARVQDPARQASQQ